MKKIAVGSKNPIKIQAVRSAFEKVFGDCQVIGVSVSSSVSDMPLSFEEMVKGSKNRAKAAMKKIEADFGVGMEAGFEKEEIGTFLSGFVAITNKDNLWGYAQGGGLFMPEKIVKKVREKNQELGEIMDEIRGLKNTKQHDGCIGFFTNNLISRERSFESTVIYALSRFIKKEMY